MGLLTVRSAIVPLLSHLRHKQSSPTKLFWLSRDEPTKSLQVPNFFQSQSIIRTQALTASSSLALGVSSPPAASGDLSVLLPISAVLLMAYWITNFIVPDIITKPLQSDEPSRDQIPEDKIPSQDESGNTVGSSEGGSRRKSGSFKEEKTSKF